MNLLQRTTLLTAVLVPIAVALPLDLASAASVPPDALDDTAVVIQGSPTTIDVLANDGDVDGDLDPATLSIVTVPTFGVAAADRESGTIAYDPPAPVVDEEEGAEEVEAAAIVGSDSFVYEICDLLGQCSQATVTVTIFDGLFLGLPPIEGGFEGGGPIFLPPIDVAPIIELPDLPDLPEPPVVEPPVVDPPVVDPPALPEVVVPVLPPVVVPVLPPIVVPVLPEVLPEVLPTAVVPEVVDDPVVDPPVAGSTPPAAEPVVPTAPAVVPEVVTPPPAAADEIDVELQGSGATTSGGSFALEGDGCEGGSRVVIAVDGDVVATTTADPGGRFAVEVPEAPTEVGRHEVRATCEGATASVPLDTVLTSSGRPQGQTGLVLMFFLLLAIAIVHGHEQSARPTPEVIR